MVFISPDSKGQRTTLFACLKPCQPAPGMVSDAATSKPSADPFAQPVKLSKRRGRFLSLLFGAAHAAAIGVAIWAPSLGQKNSSIVEASAQTAQQQAADDLWDTLGSSKLAETLLAAKEKQVEEKLAAAENARLQAQQLRINAEERAENLVTDAANQARRTTVDAVRSADLIHLDTTYIGAEQVIYAEAGGDITLKFASRIQCKDGSFGETATATPVDPRIAPREVRNLANCYPNPEVSAGQPIGEAGEWGVAFFKLEP